MNRKHEMKYTAHFLNKTLHYENTTYRNTSEVGKIPRPPHDSVEAVVGEVEERHEQVLVVALKLAATTLLVAVVLRHHRLHRLHVLQDRRRVRLKQDRGAGLRLKMYIVKIPRRFSANT